MSGKSANLPPNQNAEATPETAGTETAPATAGTETAPAPAGAESTPETTGDTQAALPLRCSLTGEEISNPDDVYWAPPLVTVQELFSTAWTTLRTNPGELGQVLFAEQENVPYKAEYREELGQKRTMEQLKLIGILLVILAIIVVPIVLLVS